ncbi:hypothetical protein [Bradyrhizobium sp. LB11.1]|uniref:hypothetical protein n=1 Tax=Bradyrhizobium sp. LB11.1 TaxID=3156326 RepID=UPI0033938B83
MRKHRRFFRARERITYSDGTTEVETTPASSQACQGNQPGQTYNSKGALSSSANGASAASSGI